MILVEPNTDNLMHIGNSRKDVPRPRCDKSFRSVEHSLPKCRRADCPTRFTIYHLLFTILVFLVSCKQPTDPPPSPPPDGPDTTSHDFIWQVDTLGDGNSSILYDVAIIDENNIWAVGELYLKNDTGGIDPTAYNLARWDGIEWTIGRVPLLTFGTQSIGYYPIKSILAFSANDVWVAGTGQIVHFDGQQWGRWTFLFNDLNDETYGPTNKMWGSSGENIYIVGNRGSITHFNGTSWRRIESGTSTNINDIWGESNDGRYLVLAAVSSRYQLGDMKVLSLTPSIVTDTLQWNTGKRIHGIWIDESDSVVVSGGGIWKRTQSGWTEVQNPGVFLTRVHGGGSNDVFSVGAFGIVLHYNGSSWTEYPQLQMDNGSWEALDVRKDVVVTCGYRNDRGIIAVGRSPHL